MVGAGHKSVNSWFEEKLLTHTANLVIAGEDDSNMVIAGEDDEHSNMVIAGKDDENFNDDAVAGPSRFIGVKFSPSHMPPVQLGPSFLQMWKFARLLCYISHMGLSDQPLFWVAQKVLHKFLTRTLGLSRKSGSQ